MRDFIVVVLVCLCDECYGVVVEFFDDVIYWIMNFVVGVEVSDRYVPLLVEELVVGGDWWVLQWCKDDFDAKRDMHVVVIGAGMLGIAVAHCL